MVTDAQRDIETLAVLTALHKAIGEEVNTGDPHNLRGRVNGHYLDLYESEGATGFAVRVGGEKVGTYGFSKVKGAPERVVQELQVTSTDAILDWLDESDDFWEWLTDHAKESIADYALMYAEGTGDLPPGVELVERTIPARPEGIRPSGTLRIKPAVIKRAREALAGGGLAGLLGGGGES